MTIEFFTPDTTNPDDAFDWFFDPSTMNRLRAGERDCRLDRLSSRMDNDEKCDLIAKYVGRYYRISLLSNTGCATVDLETMELALDFEEWVALLYGKSVVLETGHTLTAEEITDE